MAHDCHGFSRARRPDSARYLRQRYESPSLSRFRALERNGDSRRAWCRARPHVPSIAKRERADLYFGRARRRCPRSLSDEMDRSNSSSRRLSVTHRPSVRLEDVAYVASIAIAAGLLAGFVPAWRASRLDLNEILRESGRSLTGGAGHTRIRNALVIAQAAGSLVVLIIAALFLRSLERAQKLDIG